MGKTLYLTLFYVFISCSSVPDDKGVIIQKSLHEQAEELLTTWIDKMLFYQCSDLHSSLDGGIICPACARIHGRIGDAVLPLMYLADKTKNPKYLDAAKKLMKWMEVQHRPDGSYMNDVNVSDWNGTTVFAAIALYEALYYHGHLLDDSTRNHWTKRLNEAGDFILNNPVIYSRRRENMKNQNVNYSASATYALYAIGEMCHRDDYKKEAREIATDLIPYFTSNDFFLFGEGPNIWTMTPNGCRPVDLNYNVEESLPNLAYYAILAQDTTMLALVERSMLTHLEFMLPDGAWDNSWGTRSFKWTYWGGRTSDGFMGGFYVLADKHPEFFTAIRRNISLLRKATFDGLLYGGMHYRDSGVSPCIHHSLGHSKALASFLEHKKWPSDKEVALPRDSAYGVKFFKDIRTWLVAEGPWRATVTGFDAEYKIKGTHPMGGAISVLWHQVAGPLFAATMNRYCLIEAPNMQSHTKKYLMSGTPRIEIQRAGVSYSNLDDLQTKMEYRDEAGVHHFYVQSNLVDIDQRCPFDKPVNATLHYAFSDQRVIIEAECKEDASLVLPLIASPKEKISMADGMVTVQKQETQLCLKCSSGEMSMAPTNDDLRIFNPVPGFSFVPIIITSKRGEKMSVEIFCN